MAKLFVVGLGPGCREMRSLECISALEEATDFIGYSKYLELVHDEYPDKVYHTSFMRDEVNRCRKALELAQEGKCTAMICSGDSSVYGMASLIYELSVDFTNVEIINVAGITAALSGGAILGSPLTHDFCCISLSDLLTEWSLIEKRLECTSMADMTIVLYNPSSHSRKDHLMKACDIMLKHKSPDTVCGYVKNIGRDGETCRVLTLKELRDTEVDMFTTVFIGNSMTKVIGGRMVTPRGYRG